MRSAWKLFALMLLPFLASGTAAAGKTISTIDLAKPFGTEAAWQLIAEQGEDATDVAGNPAPGAIRLCISKDAGRSCDSSLRGLLRVGAGGDAFDEPHYLLDARIVHPARGRALLLVQVASVASANGDQRIATRLIGYDRARDAFVPVYSAATGRNNNQEIRYVSFGPLKGAVIFADSPFGPPFTYVVTVSRPGAAGAYREVLRFRSSTRYGDGNSLAVIDSEMPNIQRRLRIWRPGKPLPAPTTCAKPHLVKGALWCS